MTTSPLKLTLKSHLIFPIYLVTLIFLVAVFYYSISQNLFIWFNPDEINPILLQRSRGVLDCALYYYNNLTINRLSAAYSICSFGFFSDLFTDPFLGLVSARAAFYLTLLLCLVFFLKNILMQRLQESLFIALILSASSFFIVFDSSQHFVYGLDLSIYFLGQCSFLLLFALFFKAIKSKLHFTIFCFIFAINLNSHEIYLPLSSGFIALFYIYRCPLPGNISIYLKLRIFLQGLFRDPHVLVLLTIFILSAIATLSAPSLEIRYKTWPSTGSQFDGILSAILGAEELLLLLSHYDYLILLVFLLGTLIAIQSTKSSNELLRRENRMFWVFLILSPLLFFFITQFLVGKTPSLQGRAFFSNPETSLASLLLFGNPESKLKYMGQLWVRQNIQVVFGFIINVFLAGYFVGRVLTKARFFKVLQTSWSGILKRNFTLLLAFFVFAVILEKSHPYRELGLQSLIYVFHSLKVSNQKIHDFRNLIASKDEDEIKFYAKPIEIPFLWKSISKDTRPWTNEAVLEGLAFSWDMNNNHGKLNEELFNKLKNIPTYMHWLPNYINTFNKIYEKKMAGVCHAIKSNSACYFNQKVNVDELNRILSSFRIINPVSINWDSATGVKKSNYKNECFIIHDNETAQEHFLASNFELLPGLHYFRFSSNRLPDGVGTIFYFITSGPNFIIPSINESFSMVPGVVSGSLADDDVYYSGIKVMEEAWVHELIIKTNYNRRYNLRFQHIDLDNNGTTIYKAKPNKNSVLCKASYKYLKD